MTDEQLDSLESAARAATPGPWEKKEGPDFSEIFAKSINIALIGSQHEDATYITAANPAVVLELIAELRQLQIERDWLAEKCESMAHALDPCEFYPAYYWKDQARQYIEEIACQKN